MCHNTGGGHLTFLHSWKNDDLIQNETLHASLATLTSPVSSSPRVSLQHHWGVNGGKCGICGDAYDRPREHEAGGKYATGTIVRSYRAGQVMPILIQITSKYHSSIVSMFVLHHIIK